MTKKRLSAKQAQQRTYNGQNESQDSQLIMEQYHRLHGIGQLSSSSTSEKRLQLTTAGRLHIVCQGTNLKEADLGTALTESFLEELPRARANAEAEASSTKYAPVAKTRIATESDRNWSQQIRDRKVNTAVFAPASTSASRSSLAWDTDGKQLPGVFHNNNALPHTLHRTAPPNRRRQYKGMDDLMSESPTQSNEGRSYEQYRESYDRGISSSQPTKEQEDTASTSLPDHQDSQVSHIISSHDRRTLHEGDTGTVKFNWHPPDYDIDQDVNISQENEYEGEDERVDSDAVLSTSQPMPKSQPGLDVAAILGRHSMPPSTMPPPETPVVTQRPFSKDTSTKSLMGASQLFQATSGVKKLASPTSSRPSPSVFEHNTISPNNLSSPLKNRGLRTSPLQDLATSPALPVPDTSSKPCESELDDDQDQSQAQGQELEIETVPRSPTVTQPKLKPRPEPISDYAPIRNLPSERIQDVGETDSESESNESQERRNLAKLKQERANKSLNNISFPRQNSKGNMIEVPSTNRRKQKNPAQFITSALVTQKNYAQQCYREPDIAEDETQETVVDSQDTTAKSTSIEPASAPRSLVPNSAENSNDDTPQPELPTAPVRNNETTESKETIPETSPPRKTRDKLPHRLGQIKPSLATEQRSLRSSQRTVQSSRLGSDEAKVLPSSPPVPQLVAALSSLSSSVQFARRSMRLKVAVTPAPSSAASVSRQEPSTSSSSLTVLTETPRVSSSTTPETEAAGAEADPGMKPGPAAVASVVSSPAAAKHLRQKPPAKLKTYASPKDRISVRSMKVSRQASVSTDDLALSTPTSASKLRPSRSFARRSTNDVRQPPLSTGMFHDMTFATSFQSEQEKRTVEKMIIGAGGTIVPRGFDELVQVGPFESNERPSLKQGRGAGFAALITDTHSRKPKYMQALALGLPCLSWKWIASCIRANAILDWSTYLLCAGQSQVLGAIRSRSLDSYDAADARIEEIIERRPRLLNDAKILLVMKKSKKEEEKRMQYVYLAQVLGASLVRVGTLEEARLELRKKDELHDSFDWVYVDGQHVNTDTILFGQSQAQASTQPVSRKRKRQSMTESVDGPPPKRIRTLTDELVVQSLILGRLVTDDEMQDSLL